MLIDTVTVVLAFILAFMLRFDGSSDPASKYLAKYLIALPLLLAIRLGVNLVFRLYQRLWRYASIEEMVAVVMSSVVGTTLFAASVFMLSIQGPESPFFGFPRSIYGIEMLLYVAFLGSSRFSLRVIRASRLVNGRAITTAGSSPSKPVLIVGAGDAGAMVAKELNARPRLGMEPIGFVDDDPTKKGKWIHGIRVVGSCADLPRLVKSDMVSEVIVAMPTAPGAVIRDVVRSCEQLGVKVLTVPGIAELISGRVTISQIRPVQLEDLLRREPANIDLESIAGYLKDAIVIVTGAGGSIGSELCRQIMDFHPAKLLLLGRGENSIYQIHTELLSRSNGATELIPLIADIRDVPRIKALMIEYQPDVVFHAAAHKHVPLMESNPSEAVATNIFGTKNLLDTSVDVGVESFVLVSTDKAVNPTSVMGATKRMAEKLLQDTATKTGRRYVAVRFGNVLGSRGSVVPLFKQQIEMGGPVTVTHPEITRFFMTIPEAAQLIIQAAAMGSGGEIFVLDMGQPIKIFDLALDLIRLSGLEPFKDIEIVITGLRPGEKLYEEIFTTSEKRISTKNSRIFISSLQQTESCRLEQGLQELSNLVYTGELSYKAFKIALAHIIPEYSIAVDNDPPAPLTAPKEVALNT